MSEQLSPGMHAAVIEGAPSKVLGAGRAVAVKGRRSRKPHEFDQPGFLKLFTALVFVYLFTPIIVVFWYSFNSKRSTQVFGSFSLTWYRQLFGDQLMQASISASVKIAIVTMIVATAIGTMLAFGLVRSRSHANRPTDVLMLVNLISPEIVTAISLLLVFSQIGLFLAPHGIRFGLSLVTVALGHITWAIAYVTIIIRGRLAVLNPEVEEAAQDLGANPFQALRLVTLPLLWPAIIASALLVFVMSFDDFVTSYFTSGTDIPPLPIQIYTMIHFGVTPEINAIGSLMMVSTILIVLVALFVYSRQQAARLAFLAE